MSNQTIYRSMIHTDIHAYKQTYIHTDIPTIHTLQNQDIALIETFLHKYLPKGSSRAEPSLQATRQHQTVNSTAAMDQTLT